MTEITSKNINKKITIKGILVKAEQPQPVYEEIVCTCKSCLRGYTYEQNFLRQINSQYNKPQVCTECGGKSFKINYEECEFTDIQKLIFNVNSQNIAVYLKNDLCSMNMGLRYEITGVLRVNTMANPFYYYLDADIIRRI